MISVNNGATKYETRMADLLNIRLGYGNITGCESCQEFIFAGPESGKTCFKGKNCLALAVIDTYRQARRLS